MHACSAFIFKSGEFLQKSKLNIFKLTSIKIHDSLFEITGSPSSERQIATLKLSRVSKSCFLLRKLADAIYIDFCCNSEQLSWKK